MKRGFLISISLVILLAVGWKAKSGLDLASKVYLYGYPIVLMDETRGTLLLQNPEGVNQFNHSTVFPDHEYRNVARPNVDTLYSTAWIDLDEQPIILSIPQIKDRYYVMPLMDMWTNVYASVGTRTHGDSPVTMMIVGPGWQGEAPQGVELNRSPTRHNWLIGRIEARGRNDFPEVHKLQQQLQLQTLSAWRAGQQTKPFDNPIDSKARRVDPNLAVTALSAKAFVQELVELLDREGTPEAEAEMLDSIHLLNKRLENSALSRWFYQQVFTLIRAGVKQRLENRDANENGWMVHRSVIGRYGIDYPFRAAVAMVGLGALPPEEAVYPNTEKDSEGMPLNGRHRYRIRFAAGRLPPVDAFWSLSLYDQQGFFIASETNRYAVGDRDQLYFEEDGSLVIHIQADPPGLTNANWLPSPTGNFLLTMRLYLPTQSFLAGDWQVPKIERVTP